MTKQDNSKPQAGVAPTDTAAPMAALGPAPTGGPAAPNAVHEAGPPREPKTRDGLIFASILIVSVAVSMMCLSQFGLSLPISGVVGVVTLALLMLVHKQTQKTAQIAELKAELARTRQPAKPKAAPRAAATPTSAEARIRELSRDIGNLVPRQDGESSVGPTAQPSAPGQVPSDLLTERAARKLQRTLQQAPTETLPKAETEVAADMTAAMSAPASEAATPAAQTGASEPVREQWSFRPRTDAQASAQEPYGPMAAGSMGPQAPKAPAATTIEGDLELVQRKIRELADEVNAAEALRPKPARVSPRPASPSSALEDSIGALRAAAKNMRGRPSLGDFIPKLEAEAFAPAPANNPEPPREGLGELVIPATAERIAGSDPAGPPAPHAKRDFASPDLELPLPDFVAQPGPALPPRDAAIARAVEEDAMDVLLGPIVTLAAHSVSHYEMSVRLRSPAGEPLDASEDDFAVVGSEIEMQFDVARLNRAASLAARMDARDREGSLLAEFLGASMTSRSFLEAFAHAYEERPRISAQLVLTFSQRAVEAFSPSAWQAIRDMHAYGFRLALDKVQHMGTDFAALQRSGFRFVRLDARVLLDGMATADRFVPADEILQRATLAGLSIVASGVQDAEMQKRLLEAGVLLGQGPLFGTARQVHIDSTVNQPPDHSAAA
ncbi:MAG: EAL domain-containing protein [Proteobacteria bacterium]|nr:EAL domain-containing protein [Pseudomonadota bacterium]